MTCSSCHDPHARANARQLRADPSDEEALCGGACHSAQTSDKAAHIDAQLGNGMGSLMASAACTQCHMADTAKTGAGEPGITIAGVQYWQNDVSSHLFDVPDKSASSKVSPGVDMPTPYTDACGQGCHSSL
jgi:predicted CXXCH cytochrome family protein